MNTVRPPLSTLLRRLFFGFALLVLISACFYWTLTSNSGLMIAFLMPVVAGLMAALGVVMLVVALHGDWFPGRGFWPAVLVVVWVLAPVLAGPSFAFYLTDQIENYYASPIYTAWYNGWTGVTIAPEGERLHYTDCSMDSYTATYTIKAQRELELGFALLDRNGVRAEDAGPEPASSIGEQLAYLREALYSLVDMHGELGAYRVPAGTHTLVVDADTPFQLSILDSHPLWAPDLWLAGEERYHTLYADNHTWEELVATAARFRPADCPPLCSRLDVQSAAADAPSSEPNARLRGVLGESPIDSNHDGYYEMLDVDVALNVRTPGDYWVEGSLQAKGALEPLVARYFASYVEPLCSGQHTVTLRFPGEDLNYLGADGPYTLTLALRSDWLGPREDTANNAYVTAPYTRYQFAGGHHTPPATTSRAVDRTGNGLYDELVIDVTSHGLLTGPAFWSGELRSADGCLAGETENNGDLYSDTAATFVFPGEHIRSSGCDGPYTLANVVFEPADGWGIRQFFDNVQTTASYRAEEFDTTSTAEELRTEQLEP